MIIIFVASGILCRYAFIICTSDLIVGRSEFRCDFDINNMVIVAIMHYYPS